MRWIDQESVELDPVVERILDYVAPCGGDLELSASADRVWLMVCSKCGGVTALDWSSGLFDGLSCRRGTLGQNRRKS